MTKKFAQLKKRLLAVDVTCLCDVYPDIRLIDPEIRPIAPGFRMVGIARTVSAEGDIMPVLSAIAKAEPDEVLVINPGDTNRAQCGELLTTEAKRRGMAGILLDGATRDVVGIKKVGLPVYAKAVCAAKADTSKLGQQQVQISCGGVAIVPGDIICGDDDGLVALSIEEALEVLPKAEALQEREDGILEQIMAGFDLLELLEFADHYDKIVETGKHLAKTAKKIT